MPVTSKQQAKFMYGVINGSIKVPGLSKIKTKEFMSGVKISKLPFKKKQK